MPRILLLLPLLFCELFSFAQDKIIQRIFLVGDAGELAGSKHPVCDWLKQNIDWNDSSNTLVYLGDNIYPLGMPSEGSKTYATAKSIIDYQVSVVKDKNAKAFFVPGNHDWKKGRPGSLQQVRNADQYIESLQLPNVQHLPHNGCPGPVEIKLADNVLLVCMDSEWWLEKDKPGIESDCDFKNEDQVITALKDIINSNPDKFIVLAMHHPFHTHGEHGGYYTIKQHIFPFTDLAPDLYIPLPVLGSVYVIARSVFGSVQDVPNPLYRNLIEKTEELMKGHHNIIQVAGHEHTLQLIRQDSIFYVVSGAGSKKTRVKKRDNSLFAESENGFAVIEVTEKGDATIRFYTIAQSKDLQQPVYTQSVHPVLSGMEADESNKKLIASFPDSVTVIADKDFKAGGFKRLLLGPNYREEWGTPVKVKVFDIDKVLGGLKPLRRGGGHQSRSLRLEDSTGKQWVLRSVQKFVTDAALPPDLRGTIAKDLVSDGISASYPYAALSVPPLADAAGVPHATPSLYYVPDDPRLGKFRTDFANMLCLLEEREPGGYRKTESTDDMVKDLHKDNDNSVDQPEVLRARLLDMFMMDFDRHEDQWRWAYTREENKGKKFFALPRDRDQPFFVSKGIIPSFARQNYISPQIQGFRSHAHNISTYNFNAKNFDRAFINELNEEDWKKMTDDFLTTMTDSVIEEALHRQPPELLQYSNAKIIQKLKDRRKYFPGEMEDYYRFISKIVTVTGSNKNELFDITRNDDGSVTVKVCKINKEGEQSDTLYERKFDPAVTKEIRLYGLDGNDKFVFNGKGNKIKVRVIGGNGEDVFESNSTAPAGKTFVYDLNTENNRFAGNDNLRQKLSADPAVNTYERLSYKYNLRIPFISAAYNVDDGIYLGASMRFINQGFRKLPYKTMHSIAVSHSLSTHAYNIKYNADFISVLGKTDLLIRSELKAPDNVTNFFGYGNATVFDKKQPGKIRYYRARYTEADLALLLRRNIGKTISVNAGPAFQYYSFDNDENTGRFIMKTGINGLDSPALFKRKYWLGGQFGLVIDNRDNKILPARGVNWQTTLKAMKGLNTEFAKDITQLNSDFAIYISLSGNTNFVLAERFGAGINFGNYEFFQAQYLSGTENLRGFRKYRFAGTSLLYNNAELRIRLADFRTYLFPGSIGLLGFYDAGKVWVKNDPSSGWHHGFGGGLWVAPMKKIVITASYAASKEGGLPLISFGWMF